MDYEIVEVPLFIYHDEDINDPEVVKEYSFPASCEFCQYCLRWEEYNEIYSRMETAGEYCVYPLLGSKVEEENLDEDTKWEEDVDLEPRKPDFIKLDCSKLGWAVRWYNHEHKLDLPSMCHRFKIDQEEYFQDLLMQVDSRPAILPDAGQLIATYEEHQNKEAQRWEEICKQALDAISDVKIPKWAWQMSGKKLPKVRDRQYLYEIRDRWLPLMDLILSEEVEQLVDYCYQGSNKEKEYLCKLLREET